MFKKMFKICYEVKLIPTEVTKLTFSRRTYCLQNLRLDTSKPLPLIILNVICPCFLVKPIKVKNEVTADFSLYRMNEFKGIFGRLSLKDRQKFNPI